MGVTEKRDKGRVFGTRIPLEHVVKGCAGRQSTGCEVGGIVDFEVTLPGRIRLGWLLREDEGFAEGATGGAVTGFDTNSAAMGAPGRIPGRCAFALGGEEIATAPADTGRGAGWCTERGTGLT